MVARAETVAGGASPASAGAGGPRVAAQAGDRFPHFDGVIDQPSLQPMRLGHGIRQARQPVLELTGAQRAGEIVQALHNRDEGSGFGPLGLGLWGHR